MRKSNRPPEPGARGLLRLTCPCCGKEFGTYLHVPQMSIGCRCGATISLERGLAPYEFQCSCCEFHAKGKTNIAEQEFTVPCKCGNPITLHWNKDTRRYTE
jgi:hypothetical protein